MCPAALPLRIAVAVEHPAQGQLAVAKIPGGDLGAGVIPASDDEARSLAIQICDAREESVAAIAVVVAVLADVAARRLVRLRREDRSVATVEHGEELRPGKNAACGSAMV